MSDTLDIDDRWIIEQRGARNEVNPLSAYAALVEPERTADGQIEDVATIFITNRECPYKCLMCDLWKNTTIERVPDGAIADQIEQGLQQLPPARHIKLYNSGSFFDTQAIPQAEWTRIAALVENFETVIVECHPKLIGAKCVAFAEMLRPALQIAMGLETVDPNVLPRLNKRMTPADFADATTFCRTHGFLVRAFILLRTPFQTESEGVHWAKRSIDFAFANGVECCAVVPTRGGNGAMDRLQARDEFSPPSMASMEEVLDYGIGLARGRVFMDLWDIERFASCPSCLSDRQARLHAINLSQTGRPPIDCPCTENAKITGADASDNATPAQRPR